MKNYLTKTKRMKPTGENLKQFVIFISKRDWIFDLDGKTFINPYDYFVMLPFEMQIGVYLAYYDSLSVHIEVYNRVNYPSLNWDYEITEIRDISIWGRATICKYETRNEAYKEAFKKADEIINQRLKG